MRAKERAGGPSAMARSLSTPDHLITSQAVSKWDRVPVERVLAVEALTGVSRYELRPDVYGSAEAAAGLGRIRADMERIEESQP